MEQMQGGNLRFDVQADAHSRIGGHVRYGGAVFAFSLMGKRKWSDTLVFKLAVHAWPDKLKSDNVATENRRTRRHPLKVPLTFFESAEHTMKSESVNFPLPVDTVII